MDINIKDGDAATPLHFARSSLSAVIHDCIIQLFRRRAWISTWRMVMLLLIFIWHVHHCLRLIMIASSLLSGGECGYQPEGWGRCNSSSFCRQPRPCWLRKLYKLSKIIPIFVLSHSFPRIWLKLSGVACNGQSEIPLFYFFGIFYFIKFSSFKILYSFCWTRISWKFLNILSVFELYKKSYFSKIYF